MRGILSGSRWAARVTKSRMCGIVPRFGRDGLGRMRNVVRVFFGIQEQAMKKVRVAILGAGGMSGAHAGRFKNHKDVEIVGVCDVSEEIVNKYIDKNLGGYEPRPKAFADAATMDKETNPDAVAIITPHTLHFEHGMQALDAGLHVLMKKPMVTSADQAYKLAEKVKQSKKVLTIGYNTPCPRGMNYAPATPP